MREIKFRVFVKSSGLVIGPFGLREMFIWLDDGDIPLQYTGLKGKNGKEIYEGDIIRTSNDKWWNNTPDKEIVFSGNGFWLTNNGGQHYLPDESVREVIGNIYENPELLEKK